VIKHSKGGSSSQLLIEKKGNKNDGGSQNGSLFSIKDRKEGSTRLGQRGSLRDFEMRPK
jgi:hypothetical protein